jgi:thiol-disulfide isomerase/thioredoxin
MTILNRILILSAFIGISYFCSAQQGNNKFELQGSINVTSGKVYLSSGFIDSSYNAPIFKQMTTMIKDGHFSFSGNLPYPHGIRLAYGDSLRNYYSGLFFIEPGLLKARFNVDSSRVSPSVINSKTNEEYLHSYSKALSPITSQEQSLIKQRLALLKKFNDTIPDSINNRLQDSFSYLRNQKDTLLFHYITNHPHSYAGLWILIENFCIYGYKSIYYDSYQQLSDSLRRTYSGRILGEKLNAAKRISSTGRVFPKIEVLTTGNVKVALSLSGSNQKYILVDFWASYCAPCIRQFNQLKQVYAEYHRKGFDIVGISVDDQKDKRDWLSLIKRFQLPWRQYWDKDRVEAQKMAVSAVPYNYLLDGNGKIINTNITFDDLSGFLKTHLQ